MAYPTNSMAPNDRPLNYIRSLVDFRGKPSYIPDGNNTPAILTSANITDNVPITASNTNMAFVVLPRHRGGTIIRGAIVAAGTILTATDGTSITLANNTFVPQYYYPQSRNLAQSYNYLRVASMGVQVVSSAAPNNSNNITGTFSAGSFNSINDLNTYTAGELEDAAITNGDYRVNRIVQEGITAIAGPEVVDEFIQMGGSSVTYSSKTSVAIKSTPVVVNSTNLVASPWAVLRNTMNSMVPTTVFITGSSGTTGVFPSFYRIYIDNNWTPQLAIVSTSELGTPVFQAPTVGTATSLTFNVTINLIDQVGLLAPIVTFRNITGNTSTTCLAESLFPEQSNRAGLGPGIMILAQGLGVGQSVILDSRINYEAVPNSSLTRDVKTDFYHHRMSAMTVHELPLAEAVFNSADSPVDRVMTTPEYIELLRHVSEYGNLHSALRFSWGWNDLFDWGKKIMGYLPKVAPVVGSFFGPEGTMIGSAVGNFAHDINNTLGIRESRGGKRRHGLLTDTIFYSKVWHLQSTTVDHDFRQVQTGPHTNWTDGWLFLVVMLLLLISSLVSLLLQCRRKVTPLSFFLELVQDRMRHDPIYRRQPSLPLTPVDQRDSSVCSSQPNPYSQSTVMELW